jgi:hypothetical protein
MQAIVYHILTKGDMASLSHISDFTPFYEVDRTWQCIEAPSDPEAPKEWELSPRFEENHTRLGCRVFNTHLRWEMMPKGGDCKYIYVYRDGKDACVSFYHHLSNQADSGPYDGSFEQFFEDWLKGKVIFGGWSKHLKSWMPQAKEPSNNVLLVKYEDLLQDLLGNLERISKFLGKEHERDFIAENILPHVTFAGMKAHRSIYEPVSVQWKPGFEFIRKGVAGDHRTMLSAAQEERFRRELGRDLSELGLNEYLNS